MRRFRWGDGKRDKRQDPSQGESRESGRRRSGGGDQKGSEEREKNGESAGEHARAGGDEGGARERKRACRERERQRGLFETLRERGRRCRGAAEMLRRSASLARVRSETKSVTEARGGARRCGKALWKKSSSGAKKGIPPCRSASVSVIIIVVLIHSSFSILRALAIPGCIAFLLSTWRVLGILP